MTTEKPTRPPRHAINVDEGWWMDEADAYMDALEARLTASEARVLELEGDATKHVSLLAYQAVKADNAELREKLATAEARAVAAEERCAKTHGAG